MKVFKDIHLTSKDLAIIFNKEWGIPKFIMYSIWWLTLFIYLIIIKFILINSFNYLKQLFKGG